MSVLGTSALGRSLAGSELRRWISATMSAPSNSGCEEPKGTNDADEKAKWLRQRLVAIWNDEDTDEQLERVVDMPMAAAPPRTGIVRTNISCR
jgi:hypothetical protein